MSKTFLLCYLLQGNNNIKNIENSIIKYIVYQRKKGYSYASITLALAAILYFYTMNDIVVNRKKIGKYIGEHVKTIKDRAMVLFYPLIWQKLMIEYNEYTL